MLNNIFDKYMLFIGLAGQMVFYLQFVKILMERNAENVSLMGFLFGLVSVISWLAYGIKIKDRVLIIANIFAVIGATAVIIAILIFSK